MELFLLSTLGPSLGGTVLGLCLRFTSDTKAKRKIHVPVYIALGIASTIAGIFAVEIVDILPSMGVEIALTKKISPTGLHLAVAFAITHIGRKNVT